jgi:hypothetical protein
MASKKVAMMTAVLGLTITGSSLAQQVETERAFDHYVSTAENRILRQRAGTQSFLDVDSLPAGKRDAVIARLKAGEVVIDKQPDTPKSIQGGLLHDWLGTVFIPGATVQQVLSLVQDYDHTARYYSPDVMTSRLISHQGDDFHVFMRLRKHKVVTVVMDTEYDVHYVRLDEAHQYSFSRSTRVSEIADPGSANEHPLPRGKDHGFMWRLNTYWAFEQADGGVFVECEAVSLTRDIPTGLDWLVGPFVNGIPRESLQFTLEATRKAVGPVARNRE